MPPVFSSPVVTIVHCGTSRTALGVFQRIGNRLRCDHLAFESLPVSAAGEDGWFDHTVAALSVLKASHPRAGSVTLVLPAHLTLIKQIKVPRVEVAKRGRIIHFEAGQAIPHALSEVVWDAVSCGQRDTEEDVMLVAAKRDVIDRLCQAVGAAGFEPCRILPSSLASLAGFRLARPGQEQPALLLNIGGRSTTLLQVDGARFAARTLALGGAGVTQQLAVNQDCDPDEAERIKVSERSSGVVADATQAFVARLTPEVTRSLLHFARESGLGRPTQVFLAGGGARLAGLAEALAAQLRIPVEHPDGAVALERGSNLVIDEAGGPVLADLAGAAAIGLLPGQLAVDLLPPALRRRVDLRRRQPWLIAAAALMVIALVPPVVHGRQVAAATREKITAIENALVPLRAREARLRANLAQLEQVKASVARLQSVHDRRTGWVDLLAGLQARLAGVEDVWLENLRVVPAPEGGATKLAVSGCMLDRSGSRAKSRTETSNRMKALLAGIVALPCVAAVEGERFDRTRPGLLRFDFVLVTDPSHPL